VQTQLKPILSALNVPADVNLHTSPFIADQTGIDAVLDSMQITYSGNHNRSINRFITSSNPAFYPEPGIPIAAKVIGVASLSCAFK
jgi:hypothetical protein